MKNSYPFKPFVFSQLLFVLITVTLCTSVSSALSYRILQRRITDTIIENNESLIESASYRINALLPGNASEIYMKVLSDTSKVDYLSYYSKSPLIKDVTSTLDVRDYLTGIINSNPTLNSIAIFYPQNRLLISNSAIRYDLFYSERYAELAFYFQLLDEITQSDDRSAFHISVADNGNILRFARPILSGAHVESILVIEYNVPALREKLTYVEKPGIYHYGDLLIADSDGQVLFSLADIYTGQSLASRDEFAGAFSDTNGYYSASVDGEASIITYHSGAGTDNWVYIAIVPTTTFFAQSRFVLTSIALSASITLIVGMLFLGVLSFWRSKPLLSIVQLCQDTHPDSEPKHHVLTEPYGLIHGTLTELRDTVEEQSRTLDAAGNALRENLVSRLLSETPPSPAELADYLLLMQLRFPYPNYTVLAVRLYDTVEEGDDFEYEYALTAAMLNLRHILNTSDIQSTFIRRGDTLYGLANYQCSYQDLCTLADDFAAASVDGYAIYCALSGILDELSDVPSQLPSTAALLDNRFLYPNRHTFTPAPFDSVSDSTEPAAAEAVFTALSEKDAAAFSESLAELIAVWRRENCPSDRVHAVMAEVGKQLGTNAGLSTRREIAQLSASSSNVDELCARLSALAEDVFSHRPPAIPECSGGARLVARAKAIIDENLQNPQLSLQMVAVSLNVSTAYLSRVFCRESGQTFIDYVTSAKMDLGRTLLLETDLSIRDISERLGYTSAQYFISRFKKQFDQTPTVYREEHRAALN